MKQNTILHDNLVFALIFFFITICLLSILHSSLSTDELEHLKFGIKALSGSLNHASSQKMPVTALNALPALMIEETGIPVSEQKVIWFCRIPTIIFGVLLGILIYSWSKRLYGTEGGLFSLFLYVFCPNFVAHARLATTDVYCCVFFLIAIMMFREYIKQKNAGNLLLLSFAVGLAQLTKQTALLLFPILFILSLIEIFQNPINKPFQFNKRLLYHFALFVLVVVLTINAVYLFKGSFISLHEYREEFRSNDPDRLVILPPAPDGAILSSFESVPIPFPRAYVEAFFLGNYFNAAGIGHGPIYLLGELSRYGHWYYFLVAFFLKTPLPTIIFFALAIRMTIKSGHIALSSDEISMLVSAGIIFSFFSFFSTAQIGIRYILPVYPFLYVFAGKLASKPMTRLKRYIFAGLSILLVSSFISYYPHFISYFNEICWDRTRLYKYLADSNLDWNQNQIYLEDYLKDHSSEEIYVNPAYRTSGKIIVSVNNLVGVTGEKDGSSYKWLRDNYEPSGHIAYSWLIYEIPGR